jgi:hypothetical protein
MAPELDTVKNLALDAGYLAACFEDAKDRNPNANERAPIN